MTEPTTPDAAFPYAPINEAPLGLGFGDGVRIAALHEPLAGIELGAYDEQLLAFLAAGDDGTAAGVESLIHRAGAAAKETSTSTSAPGTASPPRRPPVADVSIPREAVDAGGRAIYERSIEGYSITMPDWDTMPDAVKLNFREAALVALNAAASLIAAAELDRQAKRMVTDLEADFEDCDAIQGPAAEEVMEQAKKLRARVAELRAQS